ncbi:MAG: DUF374 domain-containing protein [Halanaerobiales bacterium]|nr:DUF374 domain-containing protein [Halanaerobiales bacterium]
MEKLKDKLIPPLAYYLMKIINSSLRLKVEGWQVPAQMLKDKQSLIFSSWHGKSWIPAYFLRDLGIYALTSLSRDGSYMTRVLEDLGWNTVRGSSSRGASRSLLSLYKKLKRGESTALTPDGPTGPIYEVKPGIIFLQQRAGSLIVPMGADAVWKKNFNSWDNYLLPLPFSRASLVFGKAFAFDSEVDMETKQKLLKNKMIEVNERAAEILES